MCCSINPIGGISKTDLKHFIHWASQQENFGLGLLQEFLDASPTAELEPLTESYVQVRDCTIKIVNSKGAIILTKLLGGWGRYGKNFHSALIHKYSDD
jgi:NAD+ synthase (glutamine-hydrolysing)